MLHDHLADVAAFDLGLQVLLQLVLDRRDDRLDLLGADGALPAGLLQADLDLVAVERLAGAVLLDDLDRRWLDALVGGETLAAARTLPPPADREAILAGAASRSPDRCRYGKRGISWRNLFVTLHYTGARGEGRGQGWKEEGRRERGDGRGENDE